MSAWICWLALSAAFTATVASWIVCSVSRWFFAFTSSARLKAWILPFET